MYKKEKGDNESVCHTVTMATVHSKVENRTGWCVCACVHVCACCVVLCCVEELILETEEEGHVQQSIIAHLKNLNHVQNSARHFCFK